MTSKGAEKMKNDTIGVDISKDHFDAHRLSDGASRRFGNDKRGHRAFVKWVAQTPLDRVVFEPTGPYHRAFERALGVTGIPCAKVNPRQARRFAEAVARWPRPAVSMRRCWRAWERCSEVQTRPPRTEVLLELKELHLAREALVKDRTAAKTRRNALNAPLLKPQNAQRLEQIERQVAAIEAAILEQIHADADLSRRFAILATIPGVSALTAFALLIEMPELGVLDAGQAATLAGLAPIARQSGRWTGHAFIRGGRRPSPPRPLHAGACRHPIRPRHEGNLRSPQSGRKAGKARPYSHHAKVAPPRKRPLEGQPNLDPKIA